MCAKLIIAEGLPGSGKSTTAQLIYDVFQSKGIDAELYLEGNVNHPADFDGFAYFSRDEFNSLEKVYSVNSDILNKIKIEPFEGYLIPYKRAIEDKKLIPGSNLFNEIIKHDIYELPIELHIELILSRWKNFSDSYKNTNKVIIFECCFMQNPVTVSMIKNNCSREITIEYINCLSDIIMPLKPLLIYMEQHSIRDSFMKVISERPKEWIDGFTDYYINQGYGLAKNLKGIDGVIEVLKARSELEKEIYDMLALKKYKIDNSRFNFEMLKARVNSIIEENF